MNQDVSVDRLSEILSEAHTWTNSITLSSRTEMSPRNLKRAEKKYEVLPQKGDLTFVVFSQSLSNSREAELANTYHPLSNPRILRELAEIRPRLDGDDTEEPRPHNQRSDVSE